MTGLVEIDLNSPEPDPAVYGPWPVNRVVRGLDGNALLRKLITCTCTLCTWNTFFFTSSQYTHFTPIPFPIVLPNIRDGILVHTGNWTTSTVQWTPRHDMPNSAGCIHGHPADVEKIYSILVSIGVEVRDNTFSGKNYPYKPQGVGVIELID